MKPSKLLLILLTFTFFTCDDDDTSAVRQLLQIRPSITIDIDMIAALPSGSDITHLVNFGQPAGVSSGDWEVELEVGDVINFDQPQGLPTGDLLLYSRVDYFDEAGEPALDVDGSFIEYSVPSDAEVVEDPLAPGFGISSKFDLTAINANAGTDLNYKYNIRVSIRRGSVISGYYFIDPKIKIKSR